MSNINSRSFAYFVLVGGTATAIQYLIMYVLWPHFFNETIATSIGFVISAVFNYLANARFTFQGAHKHAESVPRFVAMLGAGLIINASVLKLLMLLSLPVWPAQILATGVVFMWNYIINAIWTFKKRQPT
ncbi:MAG TPA: GtrA family protein [Rhodocyclaceae bacterium]|nr:GtrA family protein [Rhodocyclaceae bacterium]